VGRHRPVSVLPTRPHGASSAHAMRTAHSDNYWASTVARGTKPASIRLWVARTFFLDPVNVVLQKANLCSDLDPVTKASHRVARRGQDLLAMTPAMSGFTTSTTTSI
jgi:hypothetical protein